MYRVTWLAVERSLDLEDGPRSEGSRRRTPSTSTRTARWDLAGHDVTDAIRQAEIDRLVPIVARHPEVRTVMRRRQRELADLGNAVIEGATSEPWSRPTPT